VKLVDFDIAVTASPSAGAPPEGLAAFYWHFIRQTKGWYAAMFAASLAVALLDTVIPLFIGRLVSLMEADDRPAALAADVPLLVGMVALVLVVRPLAILTDVSIRHNALIPGATSLIRPRLAADHAGNQLCGGVGGARDAEVQNQRLVNSETETDGRRLKFLDQTGFADPRVATHVHNLSGPGIATGNAGGFELP